MCTCATKQRVESKRPLITTPKNHYPSPLPLPSPTCQPATPLTPPLPAAAPLQATKSSQQEAAPAATSFQVPAESAGSSAAAPAPAPAPALPRPGPAATSFSAPAAAAAAPPAAPGKGRKGGKRKGKKAGKGRPRADAPAATSFKVPAEANGGSDSEGEEEEQAQQAVAEQQAAPQAAAPQPATAASSGNGAAPAGSADAGSGRQVVTLQNGTLTVNADGSVSISGPDAAKVLEALAAAGVLPAGGSSFGGAAGPAAPAVPVRESSEVEYLTGDLNSNDAFGGAVLTLEFASHGRCGAGEALHSMRGKLMTHPAGYGWGAACPSRSQAVQLVGHSS